MSATALELRFNWLVNLTAGANFTNILCAAFGLISKFQTQIVSTRKLRKILSYVKAAHKMLVKSTPSRQELTSLNG